MAGTNYKLSFNLGCPSLPKQKPVSLVAVVYQPLPSSNQQSEVTSLTKASS